MSTQNSIYTSFFADDDDTVMAIYDSMIQKLNEYVDSAGYNSATYFEMVAAKDAYYLDHAETIKRHTDTL